MESSLINTGFWVLIVGLTIINVNGEYAKVNFKQCEANRKCDFDKYLLVRLILPKTFVIGS